MFTVQLLSGGSHKPQPPNCVGKGRSGASKKKQRFTYATPKACKVISNYRPLFLVLGCWVEGLGFLGCPSNKGCIASPKGLYRVYSGNGTAHMKTIVLGLGFSVYGVIYRNIYPNNGKSNRKKSMQNEMDTWIM